VAKSESSSTGAADPRYTHTPQHAYAQYPARHEPPAEEEYDDYDDEEEEEEEEVEE
jgi:hypothetical protein